MTQIDASYTQTSEKKIVHKTFGSFFSSFPLKMLCRDNTFVISAFTLYMDEAGICYVVWKSLFSLLSIFNEKKFSMYFRVHGLEFFHRTEGCLLFITFYFYCSIENSRWCISILHIFVLSICNHSSRNKMSSNCRLTSSNSSLIHLFTSSHHNM